jgi:hypothetical protein
VDFAKGLLELGGFIDHSIPSFKDAGRPKPRRKVVVTSPDVSMDEVEASPSDEGPVRPSAKSKGKRVARPPSPLESASSKRQLEESPPKEETSTKRSRVAVRVQAKIPPKPKVVLNPRVVLRTPQTPRLDLGVFTVDERDPLLPLVPSAEGAVSPASS